jgi:RNA polymerase-binding transcription factor DksA
MRSDGVGSRGVEDHGGDSESIMHEDLHDQARTKLLGARDEWRRRLTAIQADRRRENAPLEADFEEQAVQRENDATLDALDAQGRREFEAIESALQRLDLGTFGRCARCAEAISPERLLAQPIAVTCIACAREGAAD